MTLPLCVRIDVDNETSAENLRKDGWREVEVLETWAGTLWKPQMSDLTTDTLYPIGRLAIPADMPACIDIARRAFIHDRLHRDPEVPKEVADQAKEDWVRRIFGSRYGPRMWVAETERKLSAFAAVKHWRGDDRNDFGAVVDLIAVDPECKKTRGLGSRLLRAALEYVASGYMHVRAGTQESNTPAKKMYSSLGMRPVYRQRTFHKTVQ